MKILIIKPSSLGDVIHALPFLQAVKNTWPDSEVDWVISKNLKDILEGNTLITELILIDKDAWKSIKNIYSTLWDISILKKRLRSKHYDVVVDLQGLLRSGLITFYAKATKKVGFADAREGSRLFYDKKVVVEDSIHAVDKCLEAANAIGAIVKKAKFPLQPDKKARDRIKKLLGNIDEYIVITPSARWLSKRWPAEKFAALIKNISIPCIIAGGKDDRKLAYNIIEKIKKPEGPIINFCGKTDLKELTALIAGAKALITNDSGPMHIAAALNRPVVAIFGPTDPVKTGPYGWQKSNKLIIVSAKVFCSPCRKKKCKEMICMQQISVNSVRKALEDSL